MEVRRSGLWAPGDLPCAQAYSHFLEIQSKFSRYKSRNLWQGFSGDSCYLKNVVLSDRAQLNCSVTAAIESRQLRCKTAAESFKGCTALLHPAAT